MEDMEETMPKELLELISKALKVEVEESAVDIRNKTEKGNGFCGDILLITVKDKDTLKENSMIIKQQKGNNGVPFEYTRPIFENEICFYDVIWPTLRKFYHDRTDKDFDKIPKCFATSRGTFKRLALEDLVEQGFSPFDKTKSFDEEHLKRVFEIYGTFHGISMALKEIYPDVYSSLEKPLEPIWDSMFSDKAFMSEMLTQTCRDIKTFFDEETERDLLEKVLLYENNGPAIISECLNKKETSCVLNHGDGWSNNMMFKYDKDGKLVDIKLIDFQLVSSRSPVFELSYCFYTGGSGKLFTNLNYYLKLYHEALSNTLKDFGMESEKVYSLNTLKEEWKALSKFGFATALFIWRTKLADKHALPEEKDYNIGDDVQVFKVADDKKDEYRRIVKELVLHMFNNDFL